MGANASDRVGAAAGDARFVVYPSAGHNLRREEPTRFAADLTASVADLRR